MEVFFYHIFYRLRKEIVLLIDLHLISTFILSWWQWPLYKLQSLDFFNNLIDCEGILHKYFLSW